MTKESKALRIKGDLIMAATFYFKSHRKWCKAVDMILNNGNTNTRRTKKK